jgi:hypothetical protein
MRSIQIIQLPLSRVDEIAKALKSGWCYVDRDQNIITLKKEDN